MNYLSTGKISSRIRWIVTLLASICLYGKGQSVCSSSYARQNETVVLTFQFTPSPFELDIVKIWSSTDMSLLVVFYTRGSVSGGPIINTTYCTFEGDFAIGKLDIRLNAASHGGNYILERNGIFEECITLFNLGTPTKPTISGKMEVTEYDTLMLTCKSSSTTTPEYHDLQLSYDWEVNGILNPTNVQYSQARNKITQSNIGKEDSNTTFFCVATENVIGGYTSSRSDTTTITVFYGPEIVTLQPAKASYTVNEGSWFSNIVCVASCFECTFNWTKLGQSGIVSNDATLIVGLVRKEWSGQYTCTVQNMRTMKSATKNFSLVVRYGPDFTSTILIPGESEHVINEESRLPNITCHADCYPACTYQWTKERNGIYEVVSEAAVLALGTVNRLDAATYICTAANPDRTPAHTSVNFQLKVNSDKVDQIKHALAKGAAVGGVVSVVAVIAAVVITVLKQRRLSNGCLKQRRESRTKRDPEFMENSYVNLQSSQNSSIQRSRLDLETTTYESLQSDFKQNRSTTYDSLHPEGGERAAKRLSTSGDTKSDVVYVNTRI